jgi:elongation factor 3
VVWEQVVDENSNIEIVQVAREAREILVGVMHKGTGAGEGDEKEAAPPSPSSSLLLAEDLQPQLCSLAQEVLPCPFPADSSEHRAELLVHRQICAFVAATTANFVVYSASCTETLSQALAAQGVAPEDVWRYVVSTSSSEKWADCVVPYIAPITPEQEEQEEQCTPEEEEEGEEAPPPALDAAEVKAAAELRRRALGSLPDREHEEAQDSANDLCNIEFSLAFGGKILLHNANLKLGKGHMYGIMGKNGAGKTTLLTNIGSGNIEGLPESLKTVYVQHDDQTPNEEGLSVLDEMMRGADMLEAGVAREAAEGALRDIDFTPAMLSSPRSALSGGWKMKLLIIRAMLSRADILLLDEPTNHLDAASVDWLAQYLQAQKKVTALIVSHDPAFLDRVITDVIHYEGRQLVYYPGSLKDFVAKHPEAKYYYELSGSALKFVFPTPDRLDGIASTTKTILKMEHVSYTYPGAAEPTVRDASVRVCLASRIAVTGRNGAGKSTLVKMLVQETEPDPGQHPEQEVWKHRNLRIAYVAQHSFHHVEQHLGSSPVDYIKWRFADGFDREDMTKASTELTEEEEREPKKLGAVDEVLGRRKNGRTMEYECSIVGQGQYEENVYLPLEQLVARGHQKLVTQCDAKIAAAVAGLDIRPLVIKEIQSHLDDFNLEAEYGTHSKIRLLSGGQKVKLVLAAAMWNRPHLIVLDEPTNYLDREALAALTEAIKAFSGGIVIISHNSEFTKAICSESWHVENHVCTVEGDVKETSLKTKVGMTRKAKNEQEERELASINDSEKAGVNSNKTKLVHKEHLKNPRSLEYLTKVELRKLTKLAKTAGMPLKEYVGKITKESPEWKWL